MPTLYLHIGTPKTGTTAIQNFCRNNAEVLAKKGYCYPEIPVGVCESHSSHNGCFLINGKQDADGSFPRPKDEAAWRAGIAFLAEKFCEFPNVILSEEIIWQANVNGCPGIWKNLKAASEANGFQVKVIVYLRRQDQFLSSYWAQRIKSSATELSKVKWEDALAHAEEWTEPDYYRQLEGIAGYFGREAVIPRIYDRNRFVNGDIVFDFLDAVGLCMDRSFSIASCEANPSIGGNVLEIKRILNLIPGIDPDLKFKMRKVAEACSALEQEQLSIYSEAERDAILKRYEESNRLLARDYFGEENAQLFAPLKPLPPKWTPDNPYMYESIIRFFGMLAMRQQREIEELKSKFYLRRKLRRLRKRIRQGFRLPWMKSNRE